MGLLYLFKRSINNSRFENLQQASRFYGFQLEIIRNLICLHINSHILRRNCPVKHVIDGNIEGRIDVTERRGRRRKQLVDELKETTRDWKLKEEVIGRTLGRTDFRRGYGPVVRQRKEWMKNSEHGHSKNLTNSPTKCTVLFQYIYLFLFSTCFGHPSAHHQETITVPMRHWYLSLYKAWQ